MRKKAVWVLAAALCLFLTGCGADRSGEDGSEGTDVRETDSADRQELPESGETPEKTAEGWEDGAPWRAEYLDYVVNDQPSDEFTTYSFIYVDADDIPELVIDTGIEAGGCILVTYHDGIGSDVFFTDRCHFEYIERGNLLDNADGNMGFYWDTVVSIEDGKWSQVASGTHGDALDENNRVIVDEEGNRLEEYTWNGESVTREEYEERLAACFDRERSVEPERYYTYEEIVSLLSTGTLTSAEHTYELVRADEWAAGPAAYAVR